MTQILTCECGNEYVADDEGNPTRCPECVYTAIMEQFDKATGNLRAALEPYVEALTKWYDSLPEDVKQALQEEQCTE